MSVPHVHGPDRPHGIEIRYEHGRPVGTHRQLCLTHELPHDLVLVEGAREGGTGFLQSQQPLMTRVSQRPQGIVRQTRRQMAHDRTQVAPTPRIGATTIARTGQLDDAQQFAVEAVQQRHDQIGREPCMAVSGGMRLSAEELPRDPRIAAVEQVQITDAESLQLRHATTPHRARQRLEGESRGRGGLRQAGPHHHGRIQRLVTQRDHDPVEPHPVQLLRGDLHARVSRFGAIDRVE